MRCERLLVVLLVLAGVGLASGRSIVVPEDYAGIQEAIDAGQNGDTIVVQPGTYQGMIAFNGKNLVLRSVDPNDSQIVAATILKAPASAQRGQTVPGTVVVFAQGEGPDAVLRGFTITGGRGTEYPESPGVFVAGGILCVGSSPTITQNVIEGHSLPTLAGTSANEGYGGGLVCLDSNATVSRNVFRHNTAYAGGAIFIQNGSPRIVNNLIYGNTATAGGGVFLAYGGELLGNTVIGNRGESGGNIYAISLLDYGYYRIVDNIVGDSAGADGLYREGSHPQDLVAFNDIWGGGIAGGAFWRESASFFSNISADPLFVDAAAGDYRLQMDSPCINAGDPESSDVASLDAYGNPRIAHGRIDIGAAEYSGNLRPVAKVAAIPSTPTLPETVPLDGSQSNDPDGGAELTYRWTQVLGPMVTLEDADKPIARFSPVIYGGYVFELVVGDGTVESHPARVEMVLGLGHVPVAEAGLPRYATTGSVMLDGGDSTDPDASGPLGYSWKQVSGPALTLVDANTVTPTVSGFARGGLPVRCGFELVVSDGLYSSLPDTVEVVVLPARGASTLRLENASFDPNKPTVVFFGGGDCITGGGSWSSADWMAKANIITWTYSPDSTSGDLRYDRCGDILLGYLSSVAPDYRQPIQTMGHSTGGQPAIDVAKYLNRVYHDRRYAVNRVTFLDARCRDYGLSVAEYLASPVDGEQCWIDTYEGTGPYFYPDILNVQVAENDHGFPPTWYKASLTNPAMNQFNGGVVGGAYWSVVGPGKNLQLASMPGVIGYQFRWTGSATSGTMGFLDEFHIPGRLPEPVTLVGPLDPGDTGGPILSCEPSENAVRYEVLMGADPYRVMDFNVVAETYEPPQFVATELPFARTWWTVRAYDAYGSSIYADPMPLTAFSLSTPVENRTKGMRYGFIQQAIDDAQSGDEIVLSEGTYAEDIDFRGKSLTLRSANPDALGAAEATIIRGKATVVTISGSNAGGTLSGLTLTGGTCGISCTTASAAISRCRIVGNSGAGIELRDGASPTIRHCLIANNGGYGVAMFKTESGRIVKYNTSELTNCTIAYNAKAGIYGGMPGVQECIVYFNGTSIENSVADMAYNDIQGGSPGVSSIDADPLFADPATGDYHLKSVVGRWDPAGGAWIQDETTSPCIDAGNPGEPVGDEPAPHGGRINMGAYGGTAEASKSPR